MKNFYVLILLVLFVGCSSDNVRYEQMLEKNWKFTKGDYPDAIQVNFNDASWEAVVVPHDWAIYGPFDGLADVQNLAIYENLEDVATMQTGRTGGLPYVGVGWYRTTFDVPDYKQGSRRVTLKFDGAMSEARIYVNGKEACFWPFGYNTFHCDVTEFVNSNGKENTLAVRLENMPQSSRWYPGAGLYRNVHVISTNNTHIPVWGTYITTPEVSEASALVNIKTQIENLADNSEVRIVTKIKDGLGKVVATEDNKQTINPGQTFEQNIRVTNPSLWSPELPALYYAESKVYVNNDYTDIYTTRFGIRDIKYVADQGFFLNGKLRKFQGVCNHHDLGPLGAAINVAALRRQLTILKDMGCDAIRTAHNMPAPELVDLCDEMGFMMMVEPFDEWDIAKVRNGYHRFWDEWVEKDMVNMIHNFRNNPCVVMWSIGNEVPSQRSPGGIETAQFLLDICHREDPTRPVTCGMDQVLAVISNGFAAVMDIPGFNYRVQHYVAAYDSLPQKLILGAETASTFSSRGVYKFPVEIGINKMYDDNQCSSYDLEYASWSNLPEVDFAMVDDHHWNIGQFVWTGFDYLGEPTPYGRNRWPSHSSMFGIIDLASIPKDRFYLYRSQWNKTDNTLHVLPHWTWPGREGEVTPIFVYTNHPSAELFVNGKSYGKKTKTKESDNLQERYRLMWMDVVYEPGEVKVVAYDAAGNSAGEKVVKTAGEPYGFKFEVDRSTISADGKDLAYIYVSVVDKDGNLCPNDQRLINFEVTGQGWYRAGGNGDPTCLDLFHLPQMHAFNGMMTAIVQSTENKGTATLTAKAEGLKSESVTIQVR